MRMKDHLTNEQQEKLKQISKRKGKNKKKRKEHVNWNEIMGMNNRGLKRKKGGAWTNS